MGQKYIFQPILSQRLHPNIFALLIQFALKVINGQGSNAHDREEAFKEFRLMQRLSHQHVVIFLDSFQVDKDLHLVLELCEGGDLRTFLDRLRYGCLLPA